MEWDSLAVKIARSDNLPMLSQIASSVMRLADDPDTSPRLMARLIEQDPAISAKVLRVANSAAYGTAEVASITNALSMLGMKTIRALVVAIAYQQIVAGKQHASSFSKLEFWQHSLAVAIGARILGKMKQPGASEELYLTGLIHDVGMLVLDRFFPEEFDASIKLAKAADMPVFESEIKVFGWTHAEVGGLLADKWGLPEGMSEPVRCHHDVSKATVAPEKTLFIAAADLLAHQAGFSNNGPVTKSGQDESLLEKLELPEEQFDVIRSVIASEVGKAHEAFQIR